MRRAATSTSRCGSAQPTASCPARGPTSSSQAAASSRASTSATSSTSRSGRRQRPTRTSPGTRRGAAAGPAGTSSARPWPRSSSGASSQLHGGGRDLIFPHHENELAQSRAAGRPFAQVWAHNGMLRLSGEKMSKSQGNIDRLPMRSIACGTETFLMFLLRATTHTRRLYRRRARACRQPPARRYATSCDPGRASMPGLIARRCGTCSTTTSTRPRRWRCSSTRRPPAPRLGRRGARGAGARRRSRRDEAAPAELRRARQERQRARAPRATTRSQTGSATRSPQRLAGARQRLGVRAVSPQ